MLASLIDGMNEGSDRRRRRRRGARRRRRRSRRREPQRLEPLDRARAIIELCWGDVGLLLSMPRQGLGNSAIASVATEEQLERYGGRWAAMAITEPEAGSDSAAIRTTAVLDGDEYVLNGEKIYVTSGERADLVVVWATLDRSKGRAAIKSFIVERSEPGDEARAPRAQARHPRLGHGRVPPGGLPGAEGGACSAAPRVDVKQGFGGAMQTFDNTRPLVAAMAVGVGTRLRWRRRARSSRRPGSRSTTQAPALCQHAAAARLLAMEAELRGRPPADAAGRMDGRQRQAQLAAGLDGQGEGGTHMRARSRSAASSCAAASATARASCSRSGRATRRSSTSSRAPSRSSC